MQPKKYYFEFGVFNSFRVDPLVGEEEVNMVNNKRLLIQPLVVRGGPVKVLMQLKISSVHEGQIERDGLGFESVVALVHPTPDHPQRRRRVFKGVCRYYNNSHAGVHTLVIDEDQPDKVKLYYMPSASARASVEDELLEREEREAAVNAGLDLDSGSKTRNKGAAYTAQVEKEEEEEEGGGYNAVNNNKNKKERERESRRGKSKDRSGSIGFDSSTFTDDHDQDQDKENGSSNIHIRDLSEFGFNKKPQDPALAYGEDSCVYLIRNDKPSGDGFKHLVPVYAPSAHHHHHRSHGSHVLRDE